MTQCFLCILAKASQSTPLVHLQDNYRGLVIPIVVNNRSEALVTRFRSSQLSLCRCCRTLLDSAERNHYFTAWFIQC